MTDVINKANVAISAQPYNVVYDGAWHAATGVAYGVNGALNGFTTNSVHINAGSYADGWSFIDSTGNYNNTSGTMTDTIQKANVGISVVGYNTFYNAVAHAATGSSTIPGLNLGGTIHTNVGTYYDAWTYTAPNGNYNNPSGVVIDTITASKSKMVREIVQVPTTIKVKVSELVPTIKDVKVVERVLVHGKWTNKTVLVPELVNVRKIVTVNETKMVKKTVMVTVYYN